MRQAFRTDRLLVVDLELTCWDRPRPPDGEEPEVIEIGIAEVDNETLAIGRHGRFLIRPVRSSISPFCTELTGITPEEMKRHGRPFAEARNAIGKEFGPARKSWAGWGADDHLLAETAGHHKVESPFSASYIDLAHLFGLLIGARQRVGLFDAMQQLGIQAEGSRHRATDDAVNAARVYIELARRQRRRMW